MNDDLEDLNPAEFKLPNHPFVFDTDSSKFREVEFSHLISVKNSS